jgi:uncharacterized protein (DUF1015 family)
LNRWRAKEILIREEKPAIYVYVQDYLEEGKKKTRLGFLAAMKIDEKAVLRHENTLAAPKKDRLALLKEVRTNLSPVFGLFEDKKGTVNFRLRQAMKFPPVIDVTLDGVRHRIFLETREDVLQTIEKLMKPKPMYIADGHHRFDVACQYKNWMSAKERGACLPDRQGFVHKARSLDGFAALCGEQARSGDAPWNYVLAYFCDLSHNPFKIFPTHRLLKCPKKQYILPMLRRRGFLKKMTSLASTLKALEANREETKAKTYDFGVFTKREGFYLLTLSSEYASQVKKDPVDKLDVAVLHRFIVEPCFGVKSIEKSNAIDFTRDAKEAEKKVKSGEFDAAFFLRPTSLQEMILVSKKGLKMPQKSTYFYPKLLSGLVFHSFDEEGCCCCHD